MVCLFLSWEILGLIKKFKFLRTFFRLAFSYLPYLIVSGLLIWFLSIYVIIFIQKQCWFHFHYHHHFYDILGDSWFNFCLTSPFSIGKCDSHQLWHRPFPITIETNLKPIAPNGPQMSSHLDAWLTTWAVILMFHFSSIMFFFCFLNLTWIASSFSHMLPF